MLADACIGEFAEVRITIVSGAVTARNAATGVATVAGTSQTFTAYQRPVRQGFSGAGGGDRVQTEERVYVIRNPGALTAQIREGDKLTEASGITLTNIDGQNLDGENADAVLRVVRVDFECDRALMVITARSHRYSGTAG